MVVILLILIFIRPFISSLAFPYLNAIYSGLFLFSLIIWFIYNGVSLEKVRVLRYPLILFCLALIISTVLSLNKFNSFKEIYKYVSGLILFLIAASLTYKDKLRLIRTITLAGFIISLLSIYQYFFGFQNLLNYISKEKITDDFVLDYVMRKRVFLPFVTPNTLGGYLAMIIPLILTIRNKKSLVFLIPISFALLLTNSLGALLSLFLGLVIYFYLQGRLEKKKLLYLFGFLVVIGLVFSTRLTAQKHLSPIFSTTMRLNYWLDTLKIIRASPLFGVGLGNFNLIQSRYAHNSYLQIWAEMGILGIISLLWIIFVTSKVGFEELKSSKDRDYIIAGILSANITFLLHNIVDFSFFLPEVSLIWWIILGAIILN